MDKLHYEEYFKFFNNSHTAPYIFKKGALPIIFSAPHTYSHLRKGKIKIAEKGTGALALYLHENNNVHCIIKTAQNDDDPNFNEFSPFKNALSEYIKQNSIKYIFDLHELKPNRPTEINPVIDKGKLILGYEKLYLTIKQIFISNHLKTTEDFPFCGDNPNTVSRFINKKNQIFSLPIEINSRLLYPEIPCNKIDLILKVFSNIIESTMQYDKNL